MSQRLDDTAHELGNKVRQRINAEETLRFQQEIVDECQDEVDTLDVGITPSLRHLEAGELLVLTSSTGLPSHAFGLTDDGQVFAFKVINQYQLVERIHAKTLAPDPVVTVDLDDAYEFEPPITSVETAHFAPLSICPYGNHNCIAEAGESHDECLHVSLHAQTLTPVHLFTDECGNDGCLCHDRVPEPATAL